MNRPTLLLSFTLAAIAGGCDAQTGGDFKGDALASLEGQITTRRTAPLPDGADLRVVWHLGDDVLAHQVLYQQTTALQVKGEFPAQFHVDILEPPPDDALQGDAALGTARFAVGSIVVLGKDADSAKSWQDLWYHIVGAEMQYEILYLSGDIPASDTSWRGPTKAGYHLVTRAPQVQYPPEAVANCFNNERQQYGVLLPISYNYCEQTQLSPLMDVPQGFDTPLHVDLADPGPFTPPDFEF